MPELELVLPFKDITKILNGDATKNVNEQINFTIDRYLEINKKKIIISILEIYIYS